MTNTDTPTHSHHPPLHTAKQAEFDYDQSLVVTFLVLGCALGAICSSPVADSPLGRRGVCSPQDELRCLSTPLWMYQPCSAFALARDLSMCLFSSNSACLGLIPCDLPCTVVKCSSALRAVVGLTCVRESCPFHLQSKRVFSHKHCHVHHLIHR